MTVNISMFAGAGAQFFDNSGVPLAGGLVYTYAAGTTTPQTTYTTSAGSTAHANPIVLDSAGRVASGGEIWLTDPLAYKFVLKTSAAVTIATYDNVPGNASGIYATFAASSGSSLVGYIQGSTGSVATTVQAKLREVVSVKDFGAVGDGVTNDTAAINAALTASEVVFFPVGIYMTDGGHNIKNKTIKGEAAAQLTSVTGNTSVIKLRGSNTNASMFINGEDINSPWGDGDGFLMRDMWLVGNWDGSTANNETDISVIGGLIKWWSGKYIYFQNCHLSNSFGFGFFCYQMGYSTLSQLHINTCRKNGVHLEGPLPNTAITSSRIIDSSIGAMAGSGETAGKGVYIKNGFSFNVYACTLEGVEYGIYVTGTGNRSCAFVSNHIESASTAAIYIDGQGFNFMYFQNIMNDGLIEATPAFSDYISMGNQGLANQAQLNYLKSDGSRVDVSNATPSLTLNSIALPAAGTWTINASWNGIQATGSGQASARQAYALNTSAALPAYNRNDAVMVRGDCTSTVNTADGLMAGTLTLTVTVSAATTYYLYGGFSSITSTLNIALWGVMDAYKVAGEYYLT